MRPRDQSYLLWAKALPSEIQIVTARILIVGVRLQSTARWHKRLSPSLPCSMSNGGRLGEIGDLYVLPEHRRNGLARRLVEHAKAWCRTQGCSAVSVTITPAGERRHRLSHFYAELGFVQSGPINALATLDF
jgi:GNAT superfamily N-acetyltransferase